LVIKYGYGYQSNPYKLFINGYGLVGQNIRPYTPLGGGVVGLNPHSCPGSDNQCSTSRGSKKIKYNKSFYILR